MKGKIRRQDERCRKRQLLRRRRKSELPREILLSVRPSDSRWALQVFQSKQQNLFQRGRCNERVMGEADEPVGGGSCNPVWRHLSIGV
jgi:hypothetical protein